MAKVTAAAIAIDATHKQKSQSQTAHKALRMATYQWRQNTGLGQPNR
jgi:hypothetical protein